MTGYHKMYWALKKSHPDLEDWEIRDMVARHFKSRKGSRRKKR